jgi:hypothetical protein
MKARSLAPYRGEASGRDKRGAIQPGRLPLPKRCPRKLLSSEYSEDPLRLKKMIRRPYVRPTHKGQSLP